MQDNFEFDLEGFDSDLEKTLKISKVAFMGKYKDQLNELAGLSREEIDKITPDITDLQKYDELMAVIKMASAKNIKQVELKKRIENLGEVALKICDQVPTIAKILAL